MLHALKSRTKYPQPQIGLLLSLTVNLRGLEQILYACPAGFEKCFALSATHASPKVSALGNLQITLFRKEDGIAASNLTYPQFSTCRH